MRSIARLMPNVGFAATLVPLSTKTQIHTSRTCAIPTMFFRRAFCATTSSASVSSPSTAAAAAPIPSTLRVPEPKSAIEWRELAATLLPKQTVSVEGAHYNQVECILRALQFDPKDGLTWYGLGCALLAGTKAGTHTPQGCFQHCAVLNPEFGPGWVALGSVISDVDVILVNELPVNKQNCFERALVLDENDVLAWMCLGDLLSSRPPKKGVLLPGTDEDQQEETAVVAGKSVTALQCYVRVLEIDPTRFPAWNNAAHCMIQKGLRQLAKQRRDQSNPNVVDGGVMMAAPAASSENSSSTHQQLFMSKNMQDVTEPPETPGNATTTLDSSSQDSSNNKNEVLTKTTTSSELAGALTIADILTNVKAMQVNGVGYAPRDCYVKSLELEPSYSFVWRNVAKCMSDDESDCIKIGEFELSRADVIEEASHCEAWERENQEKQM